MQAVPEEMREDFLEFKNAVEFKANKLFTVFEPVYYVEEEPGESDAVAKTISNESTDKMSLLLLQGWTMLEKCCQKCDVPFMRSKKK